MRLEIVAEAMVVVEIVEVPDMFVAARLVVPVAVRLPVARLDVVALVPVALVKSRLEIVPAKALNTAEKKLVEVELVIDALIPARLVVVAEVIVAEVEVSPKIVAALAYKFCKTFNQEIEDDAIVPVAKANVPVEVKLVTAIVVTVAAPPVAVNQVILPPLTTIG